MQSGGTRDRGVNIVSVPTKSGRLATMTCPLAHDVQKTLRSIARCTSSILTTPFEYHLYVVGRYVS